MTYSLHPLFQDLTGSVFRKLTVVAPGRQMENLNKGYAWLCRCRCGGVTAESSSRLLDGSAKNCAMCTPHTGTVWVAFKAKPALVMSLRAAVTLLGNPVWLRGLTAKHVLAGEVLHKATDKKTGESLHQISQLPFVLSDEIGALLSTEATESPV